MKPARVKYNRYKASGRGGNMAALATDAGGAYYARAVGCVVNLHEPIHVQLNGGNRCEFE
jgi:hypothetical protein